jgi:predicted negative regulator of RcsB-dependent stress response
MATHLDLQEQEQLDAVKAFWRQYGNLITWTLILVLGAFAGWNGWNWYQRDQGLKASVLFDEVDRAATAADADRAGRVLADLQQRFPRSAYAQQGALLAARVQFEAGQLDASLASLRWAAASAADTDLAAMAQLRAAAVLIQASRFDEAAQALDAVKTAEFAALVADRRGDLLLAQDKPAEARAAYQAAYAAMPDTLDYKRVVEAKLTALGAPPGAAAASAAGAAAGGRP